TQPGADHAQGWRLPAQEIEDAVIRVLTDALTSPAMLLERCATAGIPSDQIRRILDGATRLAAALKRSAAECASASSRDPTPSVFQRFDFSIRIPVSTGSRSAPIGTPHDACFRRLIRLL